MARKKLEVGDRVIVELYGLNTPMLDDKGKPKSSWKGPLMKFGYKEAKGKVVNLPYQSENVIVRIDGMDWDIKLKPGELGVGKTHRNLRRDSAKK